jgi:hypothetical protein
MMRRFPLIHAFVPYAFAVLAAASANAQGVAAPQGPAPAAEPPPAAQQPQAPAAQQPQAPTADQPAAPTAQQPAGAEQPAVPPPVGAIAPAAPAGPNVAAQPAQPAAPAQHTLSEQEARRIAAERWRARALLAQARAERAAAQRNAEREQEETHVRGDAGAAIAIGISVESPWYTDPGFDVFRDEDRTTRFGLWAAHDLISLQPDLILAAELGWGREHESENGLLGGTLRSELDTHAFFAGVQLRWVPLAMLQPYARLAGGAALLDAELHTNAPAEEFDEDELSPFGDAVSPFGSLGAGVMLRTPTRMFENRRGGNASLSFGLMLEGGYTLAKPVEFTLDGEGPGERDIALAESELGTLDRSGPYARLSFVVRF